MKQALHQLARAGRYGLVKRLLDDPDILVADVNQRDDSGWTVVMAAACNGHTEVVRLLAERGADLNLVNEKQAGWTALILATKWGHIDTVMALTQLGADKEIKDKRGKKAIYYAFNNEDLKIISRNRSLHQLARDGRYEDVRRLLDGGEDVNKRDDSGWTVVMAAACNGQTKVVRLLAVRGADLNLVNEKQAGWTALILATKWGHTDTVRVLTEMGADKETKDKRGMAAIDYALTNRYLNWDLISFVIYKGANINAVDDEDGEGSNLLIKAVLEESIQLVKMCIDFGADLNIQDSEGRTALMWSIGRMVDKVIVDLLIEAGADLNLQDVYGVTALMTVASFGQNVDLVKKLVHQGADINAKNGKTGETALMMCILDKCIHQPEIERRKILEFLIQQDCLEIDIQENEGRTALMTACEFGEADIVKLIVAKNANINIKDNVGKTALIHALESGILKGCNDETVRYLLDHGANIDIKDNAGKTALIYAVESCSIEDHGVDNVIRLLDNGANIDVKDNEGKTALMYALEGCNIEVSKFLLEDGANIDIEDKKKDTALVYAFENEMFDIAFILLRLNREPPARIMKKLLKIQEDFDNDIFASDSSLESDPGRFGDGWMKKGFL